MFLSKINPAPEGKHMKTGYLSLPASYLKTYPKFRLSIPMTPRLIRPHPYTNQSILALARGPVVYCVEDADHAWVGDHFKVCFFFSPAACHHPNDDSPSSCR